MKVRFLRSIGVRDTLGKGTDNPTSPEFPKKPDGSMYVEGEEADLKNADAEKVIAAGVATPVGTMKAGPGAAEPADYDAWTVEELHKEATARNLDGRSGLDKAGLAKALAKDDAKKGK